MLIDFKSFITVEPNISNIYFIKIELFTRNIYNLQWKV